LSRNKVFYEELGNSKIIDSLAKILNTTATNIKIIHQQNNIVNVFGLLVHPQHGETFPFPWNRGPLEISEFGNVLTFIDSFMDYIFKVLKSHNMIANVGKLFVSLETEPATKLSIIRLLLQYAKKSKENCSNLAKSPEFEQILPQCINSGDHLIFGTFTQIYSLVVKNKNYSRADEFKLKPNYILEEFERNVTEHPYISVICLNTIGIYIAQSEEVYFQLKKQISSKSFIKKLGLLFTSNFDKMTEVKKLEGSCYNFPQNGYYDGIFTYMNAFFGRLSRTREDLPVLFLTLKELNFNDRLINVIKNLSPKSEISPKGF
jgi:fused